MDNEKNYGKRFRPAIRDDGREDGPGLDTALLRGDNRSTPRSSTSEGRTYSSTSQGNVYQTATSSTAQLSISSLRRLISLLLILFLLIGCDSHLLLTYLSLSPSQLFSPPPLLYVLKVSDLLYDLA